MTNITPILPDNIINAFAGGDLTGPSEDDQAEIRAIIPDGSEYLPPFASLGGWTLQRFEVSPLQAIAFNANNLWPPPSLLEQVGGVATHSRSIAPGTYTRLIFDGATTPIMSDTHAEKLDHLDFIQIAQGEILVTGLGMGLVAYSLCLKTSVTSVHVIERNQDIISLVYPYLYAGLGRQGVAPKLEISHGDAYSFLLYDAYDFAWHDIWGEVSDHNLTKFKEIKAHYKNNVKCQHFWAYDECLSMKRVLDKSSEMFVRTDQEGVFDVIFLTQGGQEFKETVFASSPQHAVEFLADNMLTQGLPIAEIVSIAPFVDVGLGEHNEC